MNKVIVDFRCKLTGEYHRVGSTYPSDDVDRVNFLVDNGYLEGVAEDTPSSVSVDLQDDENQDSLKETKELESIVTPESKEGHSEIDEPKDDEEVIDNVTPSKRKDSTKNKPE